jgi:hypothetical protein
LSEENKITGNVFRGRDTDTDPNKVNPDRYLEAHNVELVGEGKFFAIQQIKGTTQVATISTNPAVTVLKEIKCRYSIGGELYEGLTIFTAELSGSDYIFHIYGYANNTVYELFQENVGPDYLTDDRTIDAHNYPENGVDIIYFTDNLAEVRFIKCEIPSPYIANFLNSYRLSLLRKGANGTISFTSTASGGTLLSGTYQFAYRMANPTNKSFTKWSSLTNPIHVYDKANSTSPVYSGIGIITNRKITISIEPSTEETDNYDFLQLAVVENIGPTTPTTASLLDIVSIPGTSISYEYKSNANIGTIPIEDITVDFAQIQTVKTINIKEKRLVGGNVTYTDLEIDNGTPSITGGSILKQADSSADSFSSDAFASRYKGYWRDEVYRFGVVFYDKDGNRSSVQPLDLSQITDNAITPGLTDMKFPDRSWTSSANRYTLFNSSNQIQSLGLQLLGLTNIPSWARSLEIVRVPRINNILFQSPIIPMMTVSGVGALDDYPNFVTYSTTLADEKEYPDAVPMTASSTLVPKNLFWPEQRGILKRTSGFGSGTNKVITGEVQLVPSSGSGYDYSMVFPTPSMYEPTSNPFVYTGAEKLDFIDYAALRGQITTPDFTSYDPGDDLNTNTTGTFYAVADNQYYFDSGHNKSPIIYTNYAVTDYEFFNNLGQPATVAGQSSLDYAALQTVGVNLGFQPNVQRSGVVKLNGPTLNDIMSTGASFSVGSLNPYVAGGFIFGSSGAAYEASNATTNKYIDKYTGYVNGDIVQAVSIVNVKRGLGDDRYGSITDQDEYISTGAKYTFTASEVATLEGGGNVSVNIDVWGGDCFVGPQIFKVADSAYSVMNQPKNGGAAQTTTQLLDKWNNTLFKDITGSAFLCIPVAIENAAQFVQVVIESEYNGEVREPDVLTATTADIPVQLGSVTTARSPLTYRYNTNLNVQNSQRVYVTEPQYSFKQNRFGSRLVYSDLKLYNSDQAGFDIFRVANFFDLEEKYYPITKLAIAGDDLYSIQERGIFYIPTGSRQIEATDGGTLAVRSGDYIGRPILIDSERGSQHIAGIIEAGGVIYVPDNANRNIYALSGQQLQPITKDNESEFRDFFSTPIIERDLIGIYDPVRLEYWVAKKSASECQVYNERGAWIGNYEFTGLQGGIYNNAMYVLGASASGLKLYTIYTGTVNQLFGNTVVPRVSFSINPDPDFTKTFDNIMINASERLSSMDFVVIRENSLGNQTATTSLDVPSIGGNFRIAVPRDSVSARLRGMYCKATITWKNIQSAISAVGTKYRKSSRRPW